MFRKIILQDAPFLKKAYPRHPIWQHPVFQLPEYAIHENLVLQDERYSLPADQQKFQYLHDVSILFLIIEFVP